MKIVIMPPNWLGDVVLAQPAMRALCQHYQSEEIDVFGRPWLPDLIPFLNLEHAHVSYVESLPKAADAVFLFPNSLRSALQAFRSRAKQRVGFHREGRGIFLTHAYRPAIDLMHEHHRIYYLDLLRQFGIRSAFDTVELSCPKQALIEADALLQAHDIHSQRFVCVAPGAQFGAAKRYPAPAYAQVLSRLSDDGYDIVVLGTPAERQVADMCLQHVKGRYWNAAGETSLNQALQIVGLAALVLCNDSGLMHVAAGMGVPTVTMFGATDPQRTSPSGPKVTVLYEPAKCSPCLQRECNVLGHPCMGNILPEKVYEACQHFLL